MRIMRILIVLAASVVSLIGCSCGGRPERAAAPGDVVDVFYSFTVWGQHGPTDFHFAVRDDDCFAVFRSGWEADGPKKVSYYFRSPLSDDVIRELSVWTRKAGDKKISTLPDTSPLTRISIVKGKGREGEAKFNFSKESTKFWTDLLTSMLEHETKEIPDWVLSNPDLCRELGLQDKERRSE
jgi:hypothetical protein